MARTRRVVRFDDEVTQTKKSEHKSIQEKAKPDKKKIEKGKPVLARPSANARPYTFPVEAGNFDLTFDESETQSPPPYAQYYGRAAELTEEEDEENVNAKVTSPYEEH